MQEDHHSYTLARTSEHWEWALNTCNISTNLLQLQMDHLIYRIPLLLRVSVGTAPNSSFYYFISQLSTYNSSKESYSSWIPPFYSPTSFSIMLASSGYCFTYISASANTFRNISMTVFVTTICCYEWNEVAELMLTGGSCLLYYSHVSWYLNPFKKLPKVGRHKSSRCACCEIETCFNKQRIWGLHKYDTIHQLFRCACAIAIPHLAHF